MQIGCELVGQDSTTADMEVLAIALEVLERLGLDNDYVITLNDVEVFYGVAESMGFDSGSRDELRQLIDGRNVADLERFLASYASLDECRAFSQLIRLSGEQATIDKARSLIRNERSLAALDRLDGLWRIIGSLAISDRFEIDLGDVAKLDYYTGLTFKIYVEGAGARVGSGGRYDNLTANFGKAEPAVGFVLDLDALAGLLSRINGSTPADQSKRKSRKVIDDDATELFREALKSRANGERVVVDSKEVL